MSSHVPEYPSFAALASSHVEGRDFNRVVRSVQRSTVAVIAPHGGRIEPGTDSIAAQIAGTDFNLYCFTSHLPVKTANLHITSHNFDDSACLRLIAPCWYVVAIHGWESKDEAMLIGGLDTILGTRLASATRALGVKTITKSARLSGTHLQNVCNRGASGRGIQLEFSMSLRRSDKIPNLVLAIRGALLQCEAS